MRTEIDVILRSYVSERVVETITSVTLVVNDEPIMADDLVRERVSCTVNVVINQDKEVKKPDHAVFDRFVGVTALFVAILQLLTSLLPNQP